MSAGFPVPPPAPRRRERWWLHGLLFFLTFTTTTYVGAGYAANFWPALAPKFMIRYGDWIPLLFRPDLLAQYRSVVDANLKLLAAGLWFSVPLLAILLSHEMGHYFMCRRYGIDASPPYFLPFPSLLGTIGAFIRIREPIRKKAQLFDIGVAGPIAGFIVTLPLLVFGILQTRAIHQQPIQSGSTYFEYPFLITLFQQIFLGKTFSTFDVAEHPTFMAAWAGLLVTAFNLIPLAQLDGGHALHAVVGERQHRMAPLIIAALVVLGFNFYTWWVVAGVVIVLYVLRRAHPSVEDEYAPLDRKRLRTAIVVLIMFAVCFTPAPVRFGTADGTLSPSPQIPEESVSPSRA